MRSLRVIRSWTAHDGRPFVVREADAADAAQISAHTCAILAEPWWMVTEPDELRLSVDQEEAWILGFRAQPDGLLLVADIGIAETRQVVGVLSFNTQTRRRLRHRGRIGLSVQAPYRGLGIGEALLKTLLDWAAAEPELERVELSVFAHNTRALNLYHKLGFVEEARLLRTVKLADGTYYDDVMMVKWVKTTDSSG
ncbi:MAG: GNAT family protein [Chloroflexi bacterium]|nr:GNAT family protein [Chloroflexota bacterium]